MMHNTNIATVEGRITIDTSLYSTRLRDCVLDELNARKAEGIVTLDLRSQSDFTDFMVVASGTSSRHVASLADNVLDRLKRDGFGEFAVEGKTQGEWVLVDALDVVIHLFKPETRSFYDLERMWQVPGTTEVVG
jgi:ribosome-associated protein